MVRTLVTRKMIRAGIAAYRDKHPDDEAAVLAILGAMLNEPLLVMPPGDDSLHAGFAIPPG